jgi:hypothetical protein
MGAGTPTCVNILGIFKMAGVKGRSGTNKGKDKPWTEALRLVVFRDDADGKRRLLKIAEACAMAAESGDMQAVKEIGDRLDGKATQTIEATIDDKRDAADWSRAELVSFIHDATKGSERAAKADGRDREPDSVH